jgi:hypothetical protein
MDPHGRWRKAGNFNIGNKVKKIYKQEIFKKMNYIKKGIFQECLQGTVVFGGILIEEKR